MPFEKSASLVLLCDLLQTSCVVVLYYYIKFSFQLRTEFLLWQSQKWDFSGNFAKKGGNQVKFNNNELIHKYAFEGDVASLRKVCVLSPLYWYSDHALQYFEEKGNATLEDVDLKDSHGKTALYYAAKQGNVLFLSFVHSHFLLFSHYPVIILLKYAGNEYDELILRKSGNSHPGHEKATEFLCVMGANKAFKDESGATPVCCVLIHIMGKF